MLDNRTAKLLMLLVVIILILFAFIYLLLKTLYRKKGANNKPKPEKVKEVSEGTSEVKQIEKTTPPPTPAEDVIDPRSNYVSPLVLDRAKYEAALQERLERERKEKLNRQAAETARLEALKNKEFQSHAGFITTLQRFSKKEALEKQLSDNGKVDKELLDVYLNEKGTTISDEFNNMSPELKAVILSDIMNKKY